MARVQSVDRDTNPTKASCSQSQVGSRRGLAIGFAAVGAISFWVPDLLLHIEVGANFASRHVWIISALSPAIFLLAYLPTRRIALRHNFKMVGPAMLLGVWLAGGPLMTLGASLSGTDFIGATGAWRLVVMFLSVIPVITFMFAAYDGSVFALLFVTVGGLLILGIRASVVLWTRCGTTVPIPIQRSASAHNGSKAA